MAALTASHCHPQLKHFFHRLREAGKPHKLAMVAVMRKLVVLANILLRDQRCRDRRRNLITI